MEYINKKWDLPTMEVKVSNLKKIISPFVVDGCVMKHELVADNRLDALYLAYYELKDMFSKVKRSSFGVPKVVEYNIKQYEPTLWWSNAHDDIVDGCTWAVSNGTYSTSYTTSAYTIPAYSYSSYYVMSNVASI